MYGWRGKIGILVPAENTTIEPEFSRMRPKGVEIYAARMKFGGATTIESILEMDKTFEKAAEEVAAAEPDVILFGCTAASFLGEDKNYHKELIRRIEKRTGIKATTTTTAVLDALKELGVKNLCVATPYIDEINEKEKSMLEGNDIKVLCIKGLGCLKATDTNRLLPSTAYRLAREVNSHEADGIFISCTAFRTIEVIERLEHDLGKPVVSSNVASLWQTLRMINVHEPIRGYGKLLNSFK